MNKWESVEESGPLVEEVPEESHEGGHDGHGGNRSAHPDVGLWQGKLCPLPTELIKTNYTEMEGKLQRLVVVQLLRLVGGPSLLWAMDSGPEVLK